MCDEKTPVDLFGNPVTPLVKKPQRVAKGYAAIPGTGPLGETCQTCCHKWEVASNRSRKYWKCALMRKYWTNGAATDIRMRSPACHWWKKAKDSQ